MSETIVETSSGILKKGNKILTLYRPDKEHLELPGGKIELNETKERAVIREILEEIGVAIKILEYLGADEFFVNNIRYISHKFLVSIIDENDEPLIKEPDIFSKIVYLSPEKREELSKNLKIFFDRLKNI